MVTDWRPPVGHTLPEVIARNATARGSKVFLHFEDRSVTYGELHHEVQAVARALTDLGITKGDSVATLMGNSPETVLVWFACSHIGAVFVPINTSNVGDFLIHQLATASTMCVVAQSHLLPSLTAIAADVPTLRHVIVSDGEPRSGAGFAGEVCAHGLPSLMARAAGQEPVDSAAKYNDPSVIMFTGGTTGPSKGAILTQNYLIRSAEQLIDMRGGAEDDIYYSTLPLFHLNAMLMTVLGPMLIGATGALDRHFSASRFWERIRHYGATDANILGSLGVMLWKQPHRPDDRDNSLRQIFAVPMPADLHRAFEERFGLRIIVSYALSEACPLLLSSIDDPPPPGYSGRPNPLFDVMLFDSEDREVPVGEVGEFVCRPREPHVMFEGYYGNAEATVASWRNLWFHTGDLGRQGPAGYFEFVDRKKDYLRRRGENISSFEVERAVLRHPAVAEAAVHAVPSDVAEDDVKLCIVLQPAVTSLDFDHLLDHCAANIPYFAVPRYVEILPELPKNPSGRVLKYELRDRGITNDTWDREAAGYQIKRVDRPGREPLRQSTAGSTP
jgi:carnitine-CoA ligase